MVENSHEIAANDNIPFEKIILPTGDELRKLQSNIQSSWPDERRFSWKNIYYFFPSCLYPEEYTDWRHQHCRRLRASGIVTDESTFGRTVPGWPPLMLPLKHNDFSGAYGYPPWPPVPADEAAED